MSVAATTSFVVRPFDLEHVAQHPRELTYALFLDDHARTFDPRELTILQQTQLGVGEYVVDAAIIGESHLVRVRDRHNRVIAVELLACIDPARLGSLPTRSEPYGCGHLDVSELRGRVAFDTAVRTHRRATTGQVGLPRMSPRQSGVVLAHCFAGDAAARTLVAVRTDRLAALARRQARVRVHTIHEYVLDDHVAVVTSETTITMGDDV